MSTSSFVSNMEGMNDGQNFNKDLLKVQHLLSLYCFSVNSSMKLFKGDQSLCLYQYIIFQSFYNSIKGEPLQWAL